MKTRQLMIMLTGVLFMLFIFSCQKKTTKMPEMLLEDDVSQPEQEESIDEFAPAKKDAANSSTKDLDLFPESELVFEDIHFDYDEYELTIAAREKLAQQAELLKRHQNVKILVEGHCDERGTIEYNLALGDRRANAVKKYLVNYGISADRISTITYGKERPLDPQHTPEAWAKNRRAAFTITAK